MPSFSAAPALRNMSISANEREYEGLGPRNHRSVHRVSNDREDSNGLRTKRRPVPANDQAQGCLQCISAGLPPLPVLVLSPLHLLWGSGKRGQQTHTIPVSTTVYATKGLSTAGNEAANSAGPYHATNRVAVASLRTGLQSLPRGGWGWAGADAVCPLSCHRSPLSRLFAAEELWHSFVFRRGASPNQLQ
jgi:hypothetical protein